MSIVKLAALSAGAALFAHAAQASILVNGGFESPAAPYGLPPGWNGSSAINGGVFGQPNVFVAAGGDYIPCCGVTGSAGALANHFATFGAGDTTHAGGLLAQSFATTAGQGYALTFGVAALGVAGTQTLRVRVFDLTNMLLTLDQTVTAASNNDLDTAFGLHGFAFTATGSSALVRFENISAVTVNIDAAVDNVDIVARGGALPDGVPEPGAWALMLIGFGAVGQALRRRLSTARPIV